MADGFQGVVVSGGEAYIPGVDMQTTPVTEQPPKEALADQDSMTFQETVLRMSPIFAIGAVVAVLLARGMATARMPGRRW
jgi:hypothetical protein